MKGLDLRNLKKIASDKDSSTFRHPDGHTIKVAHAPLSNKMRDQLQKLPLYAANGVDVGSSDDSDSSDSSSSPIPGVNININSAPNQTPIPQQHGATGSWDGPVQASTPQQSPQPVQQPQQTDPQNQAQPAAPAAQVQQASQDEQNAMPQTSLPSGYQDLENAGQSAPDQQQSAVDMSDIPKESQAWAQDLANGHITPETYSDLFAKKSTLGKVGTLFGLLLGGAGSGLTHQPNAVMEMMNREIANDLDAQKNSKANAQNYLKLNMQHELNQANIAKIGKEGVVNEAQAKNLAVDAQTKAYALSQAQMLQASYHNLTQNVDKMPEGPQKEAAKQQLGIIYSKIGDKINNLTDQAMGAQQFYKTLFGGQQQGQSGEQQFQNQTSGMRMMGPMGEARAKDLESKHVPGIGNASRELPENVRSQIGSYQNVDQTMQNVLDFAKQHSGTLNPKDRARGETLMNELQSQVRTAEDQGVYKKSDADFLMQTIGDSPAKFLANYNTVPRVQELRSIKQQEYNNLLKNNGLPTKESSFESGPETIERVDKKTGRTVVFDAKTKKPLRWK